MFNNVYTMPIHRLPKAKNIANVFRQRYERAFLDRDPLVSLQRIAETRRSRQRPRNAGTSLGGEVF
jgi:hypothetical protein